MTRLRQRQEEAIVRKTLARVPVQAGGGVAGVSTYNGRSGAVVSVIGDIVAHASTHNAGGSDALAIDAAAGTGSLRTLGTTATKAAAGNDARFTDARTPLAHASTHQPGGTDAMAVDAAAATGSLRTLGTGAAQAAAGNHAHATTDVTSGRFIAARMLAGTAGFALLGAGAAADPAYASLVTARLTADNAPIAAAVPTTVVTVAGLIQAALIGEEWDIEWILDIANSIAADVFVFNVTSSAGTLTGRYVVTGVNGVPGTGAGVAKVLQQAAGTITVASANAPGATGTIGLVTTVSVRFRGKLTVANANIQVGIRAGTNAAASSGTATVKIQSQMSATKIA